MTEFQTPPDVEIRLRHLDVLDRITQISIASNNMQDVLRGVLDLMLEVFNADRAWFLYPRDPGAPSWNVPMERTRPEWPGLFVQAVDMPMDSNMSEVFGELLRANGAIQYGPDTDHLVPPLVAEIFSVKSQLMIRVHPKIGKNWVFGLHHCASAVKHDENELQLFTSIAFRIADILSGLITIQQLRESEIRIQEQADIAVQNSERHLREAQAIAHIGSWDYDMATGKLAWSDELYRVYGVSPDTFSPNVENLVNLIHPDDQAAMQAWIAACASGQKPQALEFRCVWLDGTIHYIEGQGELTLTAQGKPVRMSGTGQDITERKQMESLIIDIQVAEEASRAKSEFLSRMSHELRTPLNAMLGFTQLMELSPNNEPIGKHRDDLKTMARSGWLLLRIIQDLLNLSAIEAGKIELHPEPVDFRVRVGECLALLSPLARERGITLSCDDQTCSNVMVLADGFRLDEILTNLVANAIKYNREGGSVIVSGQLMQDRIRIRVSDTGFGISEHELPSLFQPFSRLVERPYTIEGAGIGLSITKQLTELMGGTIGVESVLGQGSTFWIELPVAEIKQATPEQLPSPRTDHPAASGAHATLLYIEDNPDHIALIKAIVAKMDHLTLLTAHTPSLGLDLARAHKPDLILVDICLPGISGYEVLKQLQTGEHTHHISVMAISATAHPVEIEKGLMAGFRRYLTKPLNVVEFQDAIEEILQDAVK